MLCASKARSAQLVRNAAAAGTRNTTRASHVRPRAISDLHTSHLAFAGHSYGRVQANPCGRRHRFGQELLGMPFKGLARNHPAPFPAPASAPLTVPTCAQASSDAGMPLRSQEQPATSPRTVVVPNVTSWAEIDAAIQQHWPRGAVGATAAHSHSHSQVILEFDFGGRTLGEEGDLETLTWPRGMTLRLLNGSIQLSDDAIIAVKGGASLEMVQMSISGPGSDNSALVYVNGKGSTALLQQCTITGEDNDWYYVDAVEVSGGGNAVLDRCFISQATGRGLLVEGPSSSAHACQCIVERCDLAGYAALEGGRLTVERCVALHNGRSGFLSRDDGAQLVAGPGCRAEWNEGIGFCAFNDAQLSAGRGCVAANNLKGGFSAQGEGACMQLGEGCIAEGNGDEDNPNDVVGFRAQDGGSLVLQPVKQRR